MTTDKPRLIIEPDDYTIERDFVVINLIERSYPFATAPPKDWRPFCFTPACERGESLGLMSMDKEPCLNCPFRK